MPRKKQGNKQKGRGGPTANGHIGDNDHHLRGEEEEEEEEDGDVQVTTSGGLASLEEAIDQLLENRTSTREKALQDVRKGLQLHYAYDIMDKWQTTITEAIMRGFKKGKETEFKLAAHLLDVVILTLGADSESLYSEFGPVLSSTITDNTVATSVRSAAVTSLALLTFIGCSDQPTIRDTVKFLEERISGTTPEAMFSAVLRAWGLLLTNMPAKYIETEALAKYGNKLIALLGLDDFESRLAAGEVLALLFDMLQESKEADEEDFDMADYEKYLNIEGLIERLKELASTSGRHISKKEKVKLKSSFKEVLHSIESGSVPVETLTVANTKVEFYSWERLVQLHFVRNTLAEGTLVHFENNELLQQIFDYSVAGKGAKVQYSKLEKRLFLSANSAAAKEQTLAMRRSRDNFGRASKSMLFTNEEES